MDIDFQLSEKEIGEYAEKLIKCHKPIHEEGGYKFYNIKDPYVPGLTWVISIETKEETKGEPKIHEYKIPLSDF